MVQRDELVEPLAGIRADHRREPDAHDDRRTADRGLRRDPVAASASDRAMLRIDQAASAGCTED
jgi:hypothetical protein